MTTDLLPLTQPSYQRPLVHIDDIGRALDRARILLDSSIRELRSAAHVAPEAEGLAEELAAVKAKLVKVWNELEEPELPLEN
jgi:exonuclease VII small subunit